MLLATGLRVGEALAVTWDTVDLAAGTVEVRGTVIRVKGRGLMTKPAPKQGWIPYARAPVMGSGDAESATSGQAGSNRVLLGPRRTT